MTFKSLVRASASAAVLTAVLAGSAYAADADAAAPQDQATTVDTIVVTAQKREQSLQDVPVVVTAVGATQLRDNGVHNIKDLTVLTPGLIVTSTSSEASTTARIRGIGTVGDNPGLESSVGVVIDGVYRPRNGVGFGDLGDLSRIEVLKGPQGTLFGKSTSAGVINVITKAPSFNYGMDVEGSVGNFDYKGGAVTLTGPLWKDQVAGSLYIAGRERDGFSKVNFGKGPSRRDQDQDQHFWTARGQILVEPSANASIRFIADYTRRNENCCGAEQIRTGPTQAYINALAAPAKGLQNPADPFARVEYSNRGAPQRVTDQGLSAEANIDFGWSKLTSITAVRDWRTVNGQDSDFTNADIAYRAFDGTNYSRFQTFSQELRLAGNTDKLDWLVGGFYAKEDLSNGANFLYGTDYESYFSLLLSQGASSQFIAALTGRAPGTNYVAGQGLRDHYHQDDRTAALFTNDTWHVTDKFDLTAGLRYTSDQKDLATNQINTDSGVACASAIGRQAAIAGAYGATNAATFIGNLCLPWANPQFNNRVTQQSHDENEMSGTIKASYRFSPEVFTYASYARGYKSGGFNLDRTQSSNGLQSGGNGIIPIYDTSFPAEFVDSYEAGVKTTLLDRSLLLNATLFHQKYTDFQLNTFLGTSFVVRSIPEVVSKGVDADFLWFTPVHGLQFQGGVTYADTRYGKQAVPNDPGNALALLPGSQLSLSPKWSASLSGAYETTVFADLKARFSMGSKYSSSYNTGSDLFPPKKQGSFIVSNARVSLGSQDDAWTVELWGQNIFDQKYYQVAFNGTFQGSSGLSAANPNYNPALDTITYDAFLGAPRTWGMTVRAKF